MKVNAIVLAIVVSLVVQSCSTTSEKESITTAGSDSTTTEQKEPTTGEECTRIDAGLKGSILILESVPEFQDQAIDDCGEGNLQACISTPFMIPFTAIAGIFWIPFGFGIGVSSEEGQEAFCRQ